MAIEPSPELVALFGSATRVRTLAALATAPGPMTGYRIARICGISPTKTYAELYRLRSANVVQERPTPTGRRGWQLSDPDVGALLRRRAHFTSSESVVREPMFPPRPPQVGRPKWQDMSYSGFARISPSAVAAPPPELPPAVPVAPLVEDEASPARRRRR